LNNRRFVTLLLITLMLLLLIFIYSLDIWLYYFTFKLGTYYYYIVVKHKEKLSFEIALYIILIRFVINVLFVNLFYNYSTKVENIFNNEFDFFLSRN